MSCNSRYGRINYDTLNEWQGDESYRYIINGWSDLQEHLLTTLATKFYDFPAFLKSRDTYPYPEHYTKVAEALIHVEDECGQNLSPLFYKVGFELYMICINPEKYYEWLELSSVDEIVGELITKAKDYFDIYDRYIQPKAGDNISEFIDLCFKLSGYYKSGIQNTEPVRLNKRRGDILTAQPQYASKVREIANVPRRRGSARKTGYSKSSKASKYTANCPCYGTDICVDGYCESGNYDGAYYGDEDY